MSAGRELVLFNGTGNEYLAIINETGKKVTRVKITKSYSAQGESPLHTHLAIGISRGERMDWVLQKATELGVSEISPLFTSRTEVKLSGPRLEKKHKHWQQIIISACEQCGRSRLPALNPVQKIDDFLSQAVAGLKLVMHHRDSAGLGDYKLADNSAMLLIGPEGGLSEQEIERARQQEFKGLTMGPRVLRTETAPIVALSLLQQRWGDF